MNGSTFILFLTALPILAIDRLTKLWIVEWMDLKSRLAIDVLPPFLNLRMGWNQGINFGLLSGTDMRWVLIALAIVISVGLWLWARKSGSALIPALAGLVIGGALGNVWDRLTYGAVADFLNMSCCGLNNPFAFNVADVSIFVGAIGLVIFADRAKGRDAA